MAEIICVDGSRLGVHPVAVLDRQRRPYEVTWRMTRDGAEFGVVGERCGYLLDGVRARLAAARVDGSAEALRWALPDRFPGGAVESGVRAWARDGGRDPGVAWTELARYVPRDRELFAFRHRDPDDLGSAGELRCTVRTEKSWEAAGAASSSPGGTPGCWRLGRRAIVEAWGDLGVGVRAVLDSSGLDRFLAVLRREVEREMGEGSAAGVQAGAALPVGARTT
jgi:hypothetical protein